MSDMVQIIGRFGQAATQGTKRYNIAPSPPDSSIDVTDVVREIGLFAKAC
jgi:hypothetical protein